jgi:RNA polymerase sigma factor (sigma-70 family)
MTLTAEHQALAGRIASNWMRKLPPMVKADAIRQAALRGAWDALRLDPDASTAYLRLRINGEIIQELRDHDWHNRGQRQRGEHYAFVYYEHPDDMEDALEHAGAQSIPSPEDALERKRCVERALSTPMTAKDQRILREYFVEGRTMRAIGEGLGISEARVSQRTTIAIERMRCTVMA